MIMGPLANPTEGQCVMIVVLLLRFFFGVGFWKQPIANLSPFLSSLASIFRKNASVGEFGFIVTACAAVPATIGSVFKVYQVVRKEKTSFVSSLSLLLPPAIHIFCCFGWFLVSPSNFFENNTFLACTFLGICSSFMMDRMMVDRITRVDFNIKTPILVLPIFAFLNSLLFREVLVSDRTVLFVVSTVAALAYIHFAVSICLELSTHLGIKIFRIPYPPPTDK